MMAGGRVVDVLGDLRDQATRQIGVDPADHDARNDRAGFNLTGTAWLASVRREPFITARAVEKLLFVAI